MRFFYRDDRILYRDIDLFYVQILDGTLDDAVGPSVSAGPDVRGLEGQPIQLRGWLDTHTAETDITWSIIGDPGNDPGASCTFDNPHSTRPTVVCNDDGVFNATLTANDGIHGPVSDTAVVTVDNAPPQVRITGPHDWQLFKVGDPVQLTAPFTDAANDTHTCRIGWDDGTSSQPVPADHVCATTHSFTHAGMFTIDVAVTDDDGATGTAQVMVVVYDPNDGWANIDGSTVTDDSLGANDAPTGNTWVHATAKYYNQQGPPVGQVKAWVDGTSFRLEPTALEWLVVTPDQKAVIKGTGTVEGRPGYGFLLYGNDTPDSVRLVVWVLDTTTIPNGRVLYDSAPGPSYDVDRITTRLMNSGSVQIHH